MKTTTQTAAQPKSFWGRLKKDIKRYHSAYIMVIPVMLFYIIFCYKPMYGALMAFQNYSPALGIGGSEWVGFKHFVDFITQPDFFTLLRNTLSLSICGLIFGFPMPIIFALMINELRFAKFKRVIQTVSYLPHFISLVVICGMVKDFVGISGILTALVCAITGMEPANLLLNQEFYLPIYIASNIWQGMGWDSIIYIAALSGVDPALYEAASIDGAGKWKQKLNVTLPAIVPTIIIMCIMKVGLLLSVGHEKTLLLYNPVIRDRADIISTYVYRLAFEDQQWSYTSAIGLFNSVVNFALVICVNKISDKLSGTALW